MIYSSSTIQESWQKLTGILNEEFESEDGIYRKISMLAVDTDFTTQKVYNWVQQQSIYSIMAVKGIDNALVPLNSPTKVDINYRVKKLRTQSGYGKLLC